MKKLIIILAMLCITTSVYSQQTYTFSSYVSGRVGNGDTLNAAYPYYKNTDTLVTANFPMIYDSVSIWMATTDSVKVLVYYLITDGAYAIGSWVFLDSLTGTVNNNTTAPYGNYLVGGGTTGGVKSIPGWKVGSYIKFKLRFGSPAATATLSGCARNDGSAILGLGKFKFGLKTYKKL